MSLDPRMYYSTGHIRIVYETNGFYVRYYYGSYVRYYYSSVEPLSSFIYYEYNGQQMIYIKNNNTRHFEI